MTISSSGNVGIGTATPGYKLEISEDTNGTADLLFLRNADGAYGQTWAFQSDTSKDLVITGSSAVGGIKLVPGSRGLNVDGPADIEGSLDVRQVADSNGIKIFGHDDKSAYSGNMYIDSLGNFKINQTHGEGSGYIQIHAENYLELAASGLIYTQSNFRVYDAGCISLGSGGDYKIKYNATADNLTIQTNDNKGLTIDNAGNTTFTDSLIIQTDNANGLLFEEGDTYTDGRYRTRFRKQDVGGGIPLYIDQSDGTADNYTAQARFGTYSGNSYEFEVYGDINATGNLYDSGNAVWHAGNDGASSGLDADLLDGIQGSSFLRSDAADISNNEITFNGGIEVLSGTGGGGLRIKRNSGSNTGDDVVDIHMTDSAMYVDIDNDNDSDQGAFVFRKKAGGSWVTPDLLANSNTVWHAGNDGASSGLDADLLDGQHGSSFLRSDTADTFTGTLTGSTLHMGGSSIVTGSGAALQVKGFQRTGNILLHEGGNTPAANNKAISNTSGNLEWDGDKIWTAGNDGSGSGLDADLLDGLHGSAFGKLSAAQTWTGNNVFNATGNQFRGHLYYDQHSAGRHYFHYNSSASTNQIDFRIGISGNSTYAVHEWKHNDTYFATQVRTSTQGTLWGSGNDGASSGLDADTLDGFQGSDFSSFGYAYSSNNLTRAVGSGVQWYKVASFSGGVKHITMKVVTNGDNTTGADAFLVSCGSYGQNANIVRLPSTSYNSTKLLEVRTETSNTAGYEIWVKVNSITTSNGNLQVYMNDSGVTSSLSAGTEPSLNTSVDVTLPVTSSDRDNYAIQTTNKSILSHGFVVDGNTVWHAGNDGASSGLDADLLDGVQGNLYARKASPGFTGEVYTSTSQNDWAFRATTGATANSSGLWFTGTTARLILRDGSGNFKTGIAANGDNSQNIINGNTIWHAGNDGASSGLDADLLDGQHGSYYANTATPSAPSITANKRCWRDY